MANVITVLPPLGPATVPAALNTATAAAAPGTAATTTAAAVPTNEHGRPVLLAGADLQLMADLSDAEPSVRHFARVSFFVVDERPKRRNTGSSSSSSTSSSQLGDRAYPGINEVLSFSLENSRSLVSVARELNQYSANQDRLKNPSDIHLDGTIRREQILGLYPHKFQIGIHQYYLVRLVGNQYIVDTFAHEQDVEDEFHYVPEGKDEVKTDEASSASINSSGGGYGRTPGLNYVGTFGNSGKVFDYCCLVSLEGSPLPPGMYMLPDLLQTWAIKCNHPKVVAAPATTPMDMEMEYEDVSVLTTRIPQPQRPLDPASTLLQARMMAGL